MRYNVCRWGSKKQCRALILRNISIAFFGNISEPVAGRDNVSDRGFCGVYQNSDVVERNHFGATGDLCYSPYAEYVAPNKPVQSDPRATISADT